VLRGESSAAPLIPRHVERVREGDQLSGHDASLAACEVQLDALAEAGTVRLEHDPRLVALCEAVGIARALT
jgi:hypothetical protein